MRTFLRYLLTVGMWVGCFNLAAQAQMYTYTGNDMGGRIGTYIEKYAGARARGERVVVNGDCLSACTLMLGIVPRHQACATKGARFGFHAAWMPGPNGEPVRSEIGTRALIETYPADVRALIKRRGGLKRKMFYVSASQFLQPCPTWAAEAPPPAIGSVTVVRKQTFGAIQ